MPKICLTEQQRLEARNQRRGDALADGLAAFKSRNHLTNEQIGDRLGIRRETVRKVLDGQNVRLTRDALWMLMDLAGLVIIKRKEDDLS